MNLLYLAAFLIATTPLVLIGAHYEGMLRRKQDKEK